MAMNVLWQKRVSIVRDRSALDKYRRQYWSANQVIFDGQMRQDRQLPFNGDILVADFDEKCYILKCGVAGNFIQGENGPVELAGVMEALFMGCEFPSSMAQLGGILAPGSIATSNNMDFFCPYLFPFGSEMSMGIELLKKDAGGLFIIAETKVFVLQEEK